MNILILGCGTRNLVVRYFKDALAGKGVVLAADCSPTAPALYEAGKFHIVPRVTEAGYIEHILAICEKERVNGVLSLIDSELSVLARASERFAAIGTTVVGSSYELCERSLDKRAMEQWLVKHGYNAAKSYVDKQSFLAAVENGEIAYPVIVKPVRGSASLSVQKVYNRETLETVFAAENGLMIQQFLNGTEIGADCYIDTVSGGITAIFTKKKLLMRAGETDKSVSLKNGALFELLRRFINDCGFFGPIDIDVFDVNGRYFISEVNPRFGGGYPHAHECGVNFPQMIINNLSGKANNDITGRYEEGVLMMKYCAVKTLPQIMAE